MTDPIAALFFLYPFVLVFAGAILFDFMHMVLKGEKVRKGVVFGLLLLILVTIPNQFVIWSSMYYPRDSTSPVSSTGSSVFLCSVSSVQHYGKKKELKD